MLFEPWGSEYLLEAGVELYVESEAFATGNVEVSLVPAGIALTFTTDVEIKISDSRGQVIGI